jgi:hypothetical protein
MPMAAIFWEMLVVPFPAPQTPAMIHPIPFKKNLQVFKISTLPGPEGIYIIIWLSPYVLSVQSLSPPKPAGLDPQIFCRHAPN